MKFRQVLFRRNFHSFFDKDTSVIKVDKPHGHNKHQFHFEAFLTDRFSVGDAPNGGYLLATAISAARDCTQFRDPFTVTSHFVRKAKENTPAHLIAEVLNVSNSNATIEVSLYQENTLRCKFLGTYGHIQKRVGVTHIADKAPDLPPIEECLDGAEVLERHLMNQIPATVTKHYDLRIAKDDPFLLTTLAGKKGDAATMQGWIRFKDGRLNSLRTVAFILDCLPPPCLNVFLFGWVPTIEYTTHFWDHPVRLPGNWVRVRFASPHIENGYLYTDGEVWSEDGTRLLGKSRQMARLLVAKK